ncbi:MAG: hypothetical protein ACYC2U_07735 [Candidatus Amoebophilus sp.]
MQKEIITPEAAVTTSTSNPTDTTINSVTADNSNQNSVTSPIAGGALANLDDNTYMSAATLPDDAHVSDSSTVVINLLEPLPSDPLHIVKYKTSVISALGNPNFTGDSKRVEKATQANTLPDTETRVRAQLRSNAEKKLYAEAGKRAEKGEAFVAPTKEAIDAIVETGVAAWRQKQI